MNLWIRSQKKRLIEIVDILEAILDNWENRKGYCLYGYNSAQIFVLLGMYKTEKRALEVLDDIQNTLSSNIVVDLYAKFGNFEHCNKEGYALPPVYLMPLE